MFGKFFGGTAGIMVALLVFGTVIPLALCGGCLMMTAAVVTPAAQQAAKTAKRLEDQRKAREAAEAAKSAGKKE